MKHILIPIDFNFNSFEAIDYIVAFFKREECNFYFLNTYTYDLDEASTIHILQAGDDWFEKPRKDSEMSLGRVIQKYTSRSTNQKHGFNAISEYTTLIDGIKKAVHELHIDLVVLPGKELGNANRYSTNTKRIIETIRECPIMIIPDSAHIQEQHKFVLVSDFEVELPISELENWYQLVTIAKGKIKIVTLAAKEKMTPQQKENQNKARLQIELLTKTPVAIKYIETIPKLKDFARNHSDYIICLVDRTPNIWRKIGFANSKITTLGTLLATPLIALHR